MTTEGSLVSFHKTLLGSVEMKPAVVVSSKDVSVEVGTAVLNNASVNDVVTLASVEEELPLVGAPSPNLVRKAINRREETLIMVSVLEMDF